MRRSDRVTEGPPTLRKRSVFSESHLRTLSLCVVIRTGESGCEGAGFAVKPGKFINFRLQRPHHPRWPRSPSSGSSTESRLCLRCPRR